MISSSASVKDGVLTLTIANASISEDREISCDICNFDASKIIGLNEWQRLIIIILPMAWESVLAGLLLGFARSLGEFGATLMIAGSIPGKTQTISISIWEAVQAGNDQLAFALVVIISVVCILILWLVKVLNLRHWKQ